jgi:hypothetical protein
MHSAQNQQSGRISRRQFLRALGMGAVAVGTSHVLPGHAQQRVPIPEDVFGRLFPRLDPFFAHLNLKSNRDFEPLKNAMKEIGKLEGIMDANDVPHLDPKDPLLEEKLRQLSIELITNPDLSANNPNNPAMTAGTTFMGQFLDHDMTFDLTSELGVQTDPEDSVNSRTPSLDLDSVYGGGPSGSPSLYERERGPNERERGPKLNIDTPKTDSRLLFEDLPRSSNGTAIIADPRNDENMIIAGLQAAFILFHNKAVDYVKDDRNFHNASSDAIFREARRLTRWHYQWMIVHEFLPLFIGQPLVTDILSRGRKFYRPREAFIPVEFQGAVYRFGHTLVRPSYRANLAGDKDGSPFFGMIFHPAGEGQRDPLDLRGGARARRRFIGWQTFFDFGLLEADGKTPAVKPNKLVDTQISTPLFRLPLAAIASGDPPISLPQRNLLRHITWSLPSGQSIAREIGAPVLSKRDHLSDLKQFGLGLDENTPLWFYALSEGRILGEEGRHLGPVGGRIVGEVFIGALQLDSRSYLGADHRWKPTLPDRRGKVTGEFEMVDFLTFAGVGPVSRRQ